MPESIAQVHAPNRNILLGIGGRLALCDGGHLNTVRRPDFNVHATEEAMTEIELSLTTRRWANGERIEARLGWRVPLTGRKETRDVVYTVLE